MKYVTCYAACLALLLVAGIAWAADPNLATVDGAGILITGASSPPPAGVPAISTFTLSNGTIEITENLGDPGPAITAIDTPADGDESPTAGTGSFVWGGYFPTGDAGFSVLNGYLGGPKIALLQGNLGAGAVIFNTQTPGSYIYTRFGTTTPFSTAAAGPIDMSGVGAQVSINWATAAAMGASGFYTAAILIRDGSQWWVSSNFQLDGRDSGDPADIPVLFNAKALTWTALDSAISSELDQVDAGGDIAIAVDAGEGEGEGEGELCTPTVSSTMFDDAVAGVSGDVNADNNANGVPDVDEMALLATVMSNTMYPHSAEALATFNANLDAAWNVMSVLVGSYGESVTCNLCIIVAGSATVGPGLFSYYDTIMIIPLGGNAGDFDTSLGVLFEGDGDYNGDGDTNAEEYAAAGGDRATWLAGILPRLPATGILGLMILISASAAVAARKLLKRP